MQEQNLLDKAETKRKTNILSQLKIEKLMTSIIKGGSKINPEDISKLDI
jgi:hypothetical protein